MGNINSQISKIFQPSAAPSCLGNSPPHDLFCDDGSCSDISPCNSHEIDVCVDEEDEDFVIVNGTDDSYYDQISSEEFVFLSHGMGVTPRYESGSML